MRDRVLNTCILLLAFTITIAAQEYAAEAPLNNPFEPVSGPTIREVKVSNALVATIKNGDFVHPTFSANAKLLAYSKVLLKRDFESTEILLSNLSTHRQSVLLNSRAAEKYATYKASVTRMQWRSAKRLEISVFDGDVGLTHLVFDPVNRKVLQERFEDLDETETGPMSPGRQNAYKQAQDLFPFFPRDVLENALRTTALVIPDRGIVLQKDYAGQDNNIWFLDFQNKSVRALINLPADSTRAFDGGVSFNSSIIVVLSRAPKTFLFLYRDGKIRRLGEFNSKGVHGIEVKHVTRSKVIFLIKTHASYERGDNPLF
ncbi:MAG TPA: hypothetical protein VJM50_22445, partial [Pyrinomonadaceae bacterium]|nr:hypothetical protein [Pyrinomonadaceae bacterium]